MLTWQKITINAVIILSLLTIFFVAPIYPCKWVASEYTDLSTLSWTRCSLLDSFTHDAYPVFFGSSLMVIAGAMVIVVAVLIVINLVLNRFD